MLGRNGSLKNADARLSVWVAITHDRAEQTALRTARTARTAGPALVCGSACVRPSRDRASSGEIEMYARCSISARR